MMSGSRRNILAISAHPDDETLGCGGTLLKHRLAGDPLFWLIATQTHSPQWSERTIARKEREVRQVAKVYPMKEIFRLDLPAAQLDTVAQQEVMEGVRGVLAKVRPQVVYLVNGGDVHSDHSVLFTATMSVLKPFSMARYGVQRILCYETLSSTDGSPAPSKAPFAPTVFSDITSTLEGKLRILRLYKTERHASPLPRAPESVRALARYRGASVGIRYAEAFMLMKELVSIRR